MMTDSIADMLTRIRNAIMVRKKSVDIPYSKIKSEIANILYKEGFIINFSVDQEIWPPRITIYLKYTDNGSPVIKELKRISKPGRRVYLNVSTIPKVKGGFGIAILSTSKGILTDREARDKNVGGELICTVL